MTQEEKLKGLTYLGYKGMSDFNPNEFNMARIDAIREIIRPRLQKRKTINHNVGTSYWLKHCVENQIEAYIKPLECYVSNGELIYAMILEGFDIYRCDPNARFNVTSASLRTLPRSPRYASDGTVYDYTERNWGEYAKPRFKIDIEKYRDIIKEKAWPAV